MARMTEIYTDGSTLDTNPSKHGGWAFVGVADDRIFEHSGRVSEEFRVVTNNQMELRAAIEALKSMPPGSTFKITSDSQYVVRGAGCWVKGWQARDWRGVKNPELWKELVAEASKHAKVDWRWVRGHSGEPVNERADLLAKRAAAGDETAYREISR